MSRTVFAERVAAGARWVIVDGTVVDVDGLKEVHASCPEVLLSRVGTDITSIFKCFHGNLAKTKSQQREGLTVMEHVREKVFMHAVGIIDSHSQRLPLSKPEHRFWAESTKQDPYMDIVSSSLAMTGGVAGMRLASHLGKLPPGSPQVRAFWAIVGSLVADAAAQPTQWNYNVPEFQEQLQSQGKWDEPEFARPSLNGWYKVPVGSYSGYGDMSMEVLQSLVTCGSLCPEDLEKRFIRRFGEGGEYGPLDGRPGERPVKGHHRHNSMTSFLQRVNGGHHWPECGTPNAMEFPVRIIPVVALYAGRPEMLNRVDEVVRLMQDHPAVVSVGQAYARMLEAIILSGVNGADAVSGAVAEMSNPNRPKHLGYYVDGKVIEAIQSAVQCSSLPLNEAVESLGSGHFTSKVC